MQAPQNVRKFKRGEALFKEGDKAQSVFIVQSGRVSVYQSRGTQKFEIMLLTTGQIVGEGAILGSETRQLAAEAVSETTVIEVPLKEVRALLDGSHNIIKILFKSMHEKLRVASNDVKNFKMDKETAPCPQILIPKIFSILNFVARYLAKKDEAGNLVLSWSTLHISSVRLFLESRDRMHALVELLHKLGHIEMVMHKNDEDVEELHLIKIKDLQLIEDFSEFYQYNLYKGGRSEVIYVELLALQVADALMQLGEGQPLDRHGAVRLNYEQVVEDLKKRFNIVFKPIHIETLERKGLFMKRSSGEGGNILSFDFNEYKKTVAYWKIINEIDKWNTRGKVELVEKAEKQDVNGPKCEACNATITSEMKFCSECGFKLAA